jgi:outer membrane protein assembly factor BamB
VEPFEPVITDGLVLVGSPTGLFALDVDTGEIAWHLASAQALFTPTVVGGVAYAGGEDGTLRAVDLQSGREQWHHRLAGWIFSPAVVAGHLVTGGSEGTLWGLTAKDGSERWQKELGEELIFRPVAGTDDPVYVSTSTGGVIAVGAGTGELRWQARMETPTTAMVFGTRIFFVQFSGLVTAHDRYSGRKLWEFQLQGPSTIPARVLDGKILAITDEGASVMLDPEDGEVVEEIGNPHEPDTAPELVPEGNELMAGLGP